MPSAVSCLVRPSIQTLLPATTPRLDTSIVKETTNMTPRLRIAIGGNFNMPDQLREIIERVEDVAAVFLAYNLSLLRRMLLRNR